MDNPKKGFRNTKISGNTVNRAWTTLRGDLGTLMISGNTVNSVWTTLRRDLGTLKISGNTVNSV